MLNDALGKLGPTAAGAQGSLRRLRRVVGRAVLRERQVAQFEEAYADAVRHFDQVIGVQYQDRGAHLDVYTTYRGDISPIEDAIYAIESQMMRLYPDVHPNWHLFRSADEMVLEQGVAHDAAVAQ